MKTYLDGIEPVKMFATYIYYLLDKGVIVYVGQTRSLSMRMVNHVGDNQKTFDSYKLVEVPDGANKNECEFFQIMQYKPKYNKRLPKVDFLIFKSSVIERCKLAIKKGKDPKFDILNPDYIVEMYDSKIEYWKSPKYNSNHDKLTDMINGLEDKTDE